jgi:hypothetical protein
MEFFNIGSKSMMNGTRAHFKSREKPELTSVEREIDVENKRIVQESISILRKLRTAALETGDQGKQQELLKQAHDFSTEVAEMIIDLSLKGQPVRIIEHQFTKRIDALKAEYKDQDAGSGYGLPPQFSIKNLFLATEDVLARIIEKRGSLEIPKEKLNAELDIY